MPIIPYLKSRILRIFTLRMSESVDIVSGVQKVGENLFILQAKLYHVARRDQEVCPAKQGGLNLFIWAKNGFECTLGSKDSETHSGTVFEK